MSENEWINEFNQSVNHNTSQNSSAELLTSKP